MCFYVFRQKGHVLGIQFVILNSDDVRTFTNRRSEVRSFLFGGRGYMYDVVLYKWEWYQILFWFVHEEERGLMLYIVRSAIFIIDTTLSSAKTLFSMYSFTRKWMSAWKGGLFSLFNVAVFFCPSRTLIIWKMKWNLFSIPSCLSFSQKAVSREYQCCLT